MRTKTHKSSVLEAEQSELPLFLEEQGKGDVPICRFQILYVRTNRPIRFSWVKAIIEKLSDHRWIIGLAMLCSIPFFGWIIATNIHSTPIILEVLGIIAGLWGVQLWSRRVAHKGLKEKNDD